DREAHVGQADLGVDDLLRQFAAVIARILVVQHADDQVANVALAAALERATELVHEDQGDSVLAQPVLQLDGIGPIIRSGQSVASRDEYLRAAAVGQGRPEQGIEAGARELVARATVVEEQIRLSVAAAPDHAVDLLGCAAEDDAQLLGLAACPADVLGGGLMLAATIPGVEE